MAKIYIEYENERPNELVDVAQFIMFSVQKSEEAARLMFTAQCTNEFMVKALTSPETAEMLQAAISYYNDERKGRR